MFPIISLVKKHSNPEKGIEHKDRNLIKTALKQTNESLISSGKQGIFKERALKSKGAPLKKT